MSKYKRDDKAFKAQIAALADAGLNLHVGANCSIYRARPCNECAFVDAIAPQVKRAKQFTLGKAYNVPVPPPAPVVEAPIARRHKLAEKFGAALAWVGIILCAGLAGAGICEFFIKLISGAF